MFYSQVILTRKGPLGKIWLAAHFDKKLSKNQIFTTDITNTVDTVLSPNAHLALKVSGHLMLGIVRIYSKKVKYLMIDCTEAMWKMKLAFKPGKVDIDSAVLQLGIDDNRHYGNLMADEGDILGLESFVFGTQLPTLTVSRLGYLDDDSVFTDFSNDVRGKSMNSSTYERSIMSEIEDVRGASRSSVDSARTPLEVLDVKRGSFTGLQLDEDLPGFEDDMNVVFSQPNLLIDHRAEHIETTDFFHEVPITTAPLKYAETSDIKSKKPSIRLPMPLKKRRVQVFN
jgi:cohesin complex subunit SCC1